MSVNLLSLLAATSSHAAVLVIVSELCLKKEKRIICEKIETYFYSFHVYLFIVLYSLLLYFLNSGKCVW